jgi:hypothetical protein
MTELVVLEVPGKSAGDYLIDADVDADGCVACLVVRDGRTLVLRDGTEVAGIPETVRPFLHTIRWLPNDALLLHPIVVVTDAPTQSCAIVAGEDFRPVPFGAPDNLVAGGGFVFASYSERALIFTRTGSHEDDVVTVFEVRGGARLFGLPDLLPDVRGGPDPYEVTSGCATARGEFVFIGQDSPNLWSLNATARTHHAVMLEDALGDPDAASVSADGGHAILLLADEAGLDLRRVDRTTGRTVGTGRLAAGLVRDALGSFASPRPAGGWLLDAEARGLDGGRFMVRTADRLALIRG